MHSKKFSSANLPLYNIHCLSAYHAWHAGWNWTTHIFLQPSIEAMVLQKADYDFMYNAHEAKLCTTFYSNFYISLCWCSFMNFGMRMKIFLDAQKILPNFLKFLYLWLIHWLPAQHPGILLVYRRLFAAKLTFILWTVPHHKNS